MYRQLHVINNETICVANVHECMWHWSVHVLRLSLSSHQIVIGFPVVFQCPSVHQNFSFRRCHLAPPMSGSWHYSTWFVVIRRWPVFPARGVTPPTDQRHHHPLSSVNVIVTVMTNMKMLVMMSFVVPRYSIPISLSVLQFSVGRPVMRSIRLRYRFTNRPEDVATGHSPGRHVGESVRRVDKADGSRRRLAGAFTRRVVAATTTRNDADSDNNDSEKDGE